MPQFRGRARKRFSIRTPNPEPTAVEFVDSKAQVVMMQLVPVAETLKLPVVVVLWAAEWLR